VFAATGGDVCRFLRLVNIEKNHFGHDMLARFEIFGTLMEGIATE
jgi:hypothetical protein